MIIKKGKADNTVYFMLRNTFGVPVTGLVYNSAGAICSYVRTRGARVAIALATQTVTGAHADGGFVEVDAANTPGVYRLDLPDAAVATGADEVVVYIEFTATTPEALSIQLVDNATKDVHDIVSNGTYGNAQLAKASVCTETRLAELDAANIPADIDLILADTNETQGKLPTNNIMGSSVKTNKDDEIDSIVAKLPFNYIMGSGVTSDKDGDIDYIVTSNIAIKAKTDNLPQGIVKNTALNNFEFAMTDSTTNAPKTGVAVTATRSIDGAAFDTCATGVSEVGNGVYKINLAASDLNGDVITFRFTGTDANDRLITIKTQA